MHHDRGRIQKCGLGVEIVSERFEPVLERRVGDLLDARSLLQHHQAYAGQFGERREFAQRDRPGLVHRHLGIALPGDADLEALGTQMLTPFLHARGLGLEVARRRRNRVGRDVQDERQARHREPAHVAVMCKRGGVGDGNLQAITRAQKREEHAIRPDGDAQTSAGKMRNERAELDPVPQTLFAA